MNTDSAAGSYTPPLTLTAFLFCGWGSRSLTRAGLLLAGKEEVVFPANSN